MKFIFDSVDDYDRLWASVHDSILYWKKVRQMCQGKINLNVDPNATNHYDERYAIDKMIENAIILRDIEDSPHPVWNDDTNSYDTKAEDYYSSIILKTLRLAGPISEDVEDCVGG